MLIGIPKEILSEEKRVAATPEIVQKYIKWALMYEYVLCKGFNETL